MAKFSDLNQPCTNFAISEALKSTTSAAVNAARNRSRAPGEGAQIYRGLATVIFGGMTVSTLFTLILMPALLQLGAAKVARRDNRLVLQPAE
ncbi:MAG: hypothetical protein HC770_14165 [Pseudanabaena sp. CRU_2_10]|nr:hypothetical protein [Pseudanabaena sp. CRU_2_10]